MIRFLFFLALTIPGVVSMKNIAYLGVGYNIFYGNPHSHSRGLDPGFKQSPIEHQYSGNHLSADRRYKIPDNTVVRQITSCRYSFHSDIVAGAHSYKNSLETAAAIEGRYFGAAFRASMDYKRVEQSAKSHGTVFTESTASCDVYEAFFPEYVKLGMSTSFKIAIGNLSGCVYDDNKYEAIIRTFGTHYVTQLNMGGMFGQRSEFTKRAYQSMLDSGVNVKASASFSAMSASASVSASASIYNAKSEAFRKHCSKQEIYSIGSHPPTNGKPMDWVSIAVAEPMPVKYRLRELHRLLTTTNFPKDKHITCKSINLRTAITDYCHKLKKMGELSDCGEPEADEQPVASPALLVKAVSSWKLIWSDAATRSTHHDITASIPLAPEGYAIFGAVAKRGHDIPTRRVYVVKTSSSLVRRALSYERIWTDVGSRAHLNGEVYRPICPWGFNSVSDFPTEGRYVYPTIMYLAYPCISVACLTRCKPVWLWNDLGSGGDIDVTWWGYSGPTKEAGGEGFFRAQKNYWNNPWVESMTCLKRDCLREVSD